jgi:hypothetical protein
VIEYPTWGGITYLILECFSWLVASEGSPSGVKPLGACLALGCEICIFVYLVYLVFIVYLCISHTCCNIV